MTKANTFTILCVMIRAAAAYCFAVLAAQLAGYSLADLGALREVWSDWYAFATFGVVAFGCLALWLFPDVLARIALARKTGEAFESDLDAEAWQSIVNAGVGLYFLGSGIVWLARNLLILLMHARSSGESYAPLPDGFWVGFVTNLVQLAFGLGLLLGARALARALRGRRSAAG